MKISVRREAFGGERRVALTPDSAASLMAAGFDVEVERGAGEDSGIADATYHDAGVALVDDVDPGRVEVLAHVRPIPETVAKTLPSTAFTFGFCSPQTSLATVRALRDRKVTAFALELVPRLSRAQSMDGLTSQALVAGYRCVMEAAIRFPRFFPLYMTAAGTIPPARVLVLGAGVAGLQAIATAKRLGAKVSAYDVRSASADEVRSMGASFIDLELEAADAAGGYARELAADSADRQRRLLAPHVAAADVVITTAAIPGRSAPILVTSEMVRAMKGNSVVVDLAAESGGNVEGSVAGEDIPLEGVGGVVTLVGMKDAASRMASDASLLLARNIANLIQLMAVDGTVIPDFDDAVVAGTCLTSDGSIRHELTALALEQSAAVTARRRS